MLHMDERMNLIAPDRYSIKPWTYICRKIAVHRQLVLFLGFITGFLFILIVKKHFQQFPNSNLEKINPNLKSFFPKLKFTENLQCSDYFKASQSIGSRISLDDHQEFEAGLSMTCEDIKKRHYFPDKPLNNEEKNFPIAYAKNVFTDYYFLEMELASIYAPQNYYCFSIDRMARLPFILKMNTLASCFPNVIISNVSYELDSTGHNQNLAHHDCLELLRQRPWKYVILLQNHDVAIKTNAQLIQIFQWLNGSNDIAVGAMVENRIDEAADWSFKGLRLFKHDSKNFENPEKLNFAKGYVQCSLSRAAVDYMFEEMDLRKLIRQLNSEKYGIDEILVATLQATDAIDLPGGYTHACLDRNHSLMHLTRKSNWMFNKSQKYCKSGIVRHGLCIYGMEDLYRIPSFPHMFINKMVPSLDFGAFYCLKEKFFNLTYGLERESSITTLPREFYLNRPNVRYHRERNSSGFDINKFKCN